MSAIKYAIIGAGYVGYALAEILFSMPDAAVAGVYDVASENALKISRLTGAKCYPSLEELCAQRDIDAILICTPNAMHLAPALLGAANQKHIFCEKPIALTYGDCRMMVDAAYRAKVLFMAGHVMHFFQGVSTVKEYLAHQTIGNLLYCHAARNGWEEKQPAVSWKKIKTLSGGHLMHHIHELDFITYVMGVPKAVTMAGGNLAHLGKGYGDEEDMLFLLLEYENGTHALLEYGNAFRWNEHYILIQGDLGAIRIDMNDVGGCLRIQGKDKPFLIHENEFEDQDRRRRNFQDEMDGAIAYGQPGRQMPPWLYTVMKKEMAVFHQAVSTGEIPDAYKPLFTGELALNSLKVAEAANLSLAGNRKVFINEMEKE